MRSPYMPATLLCRSISHAAGVPNSTSIQQSDRTSGPRFPASPVPAMPARLSADAVDRIRAAFALPDSMVQTNAPMATGDRPETARNQSICRSVGYQPARTMGITGNGQVA